MQWEDGESEDKEWKCIVTKNNHVDALNGEFSNQYFDAKNSLNTWWFTQPEAPLFVGDTILVSYLNGSEDYESHYYKVVDVGCGGRRSKPMQIKAKNEDTIRPFTPTASIWSLVDLRYETHGPLHATSDQRSPQEKEFERHGVRGDWIKIVPETPLAVHISSTASLPNSIILTNDQSIKQLVRFQGAPVPASITAYLYSVGHLTIQQVAALTEEEIKFMLDTMPNKDGVSLGQICSVHRMANQICAGGTDKLTLVIGPQSGNELQKKVEDCYTYELKVKGDKCQDYLERSTPTLVLNEVKRREGAPENSTPRACQRKQDLMDSLFHKIRYVPLTDKELKKNVKRVDGVYCFDVKSIDSYLTSRDDKGTRSKIEAIKMEKNAEKLYYFSSNLPRAGEDKKQKHCGLLTAHINRTSIKTLKTLLFPTVEEAMLARDVCVLSFLGGVGMDDIYFTKVFKFNFLEIIDIDGNGVSRVVGFDGSTQSNLLQRAISLVED